MLREVGEEAWIVLLLAPDLEATRLLDVVGAVRSIVLAQVLGVAGAAVRLQPALAACAEGRLRLELLATRATTHVAEFIEHVFVTWARLAGVRGPPLA